MSQLHPMPEPGDPLRPVAERRYPSVDGRKAVIDTLECGHTIIDYNGGTPARRRCRLCGHARDEKCRTEFAALDALHGLGRPSSGVRAPAVFHPRELQKKCNLCGAAPGAPCVVQRVPRPPTEQREPEPVAKEKRKRAIQEACALCGVGPGVPCVVPRETGGFLVELAQKPHDLPERAGGS